MSVKGIKHLPVVPASSPRALFPGPLHSQYCRTERNKLSSETKALALIQVLTSESLIGIALW